MRSVWIIGGGKFGRRAAETIGGADSVADILIVEKDPNRCRALKNRGLRVIEADGIAFLKSRLGGPLQTQWIVAAAPIHVAYEWVRACLSGRVRVEPTVMPAGITGLLPNAMPGAEGQWYATNAAFICPLGASNPDASVPSPAASGRAACMPLFGACLPQASRFW